MKAPSKSALRISELETRTSLLELALADLANGAVTWFHRYNYAIGVSRANGAAGGIVIEKALGGMVSAYYFEQFARQRLADISLIITGADTDHNRELMRQRACIEIACAFVAGMQKAS